MSSNWATGLLLARRMGCCCFARGCLSSSSVGRLYRCWRAGRLATGSIGMRRGNAAGGQAGRPPCTWTVSTPAVGRPTLHDGPVVLRPVRVSPGIVTECMLWVCVC